MEEEQDHENYEDREDVDEIFDRLDRLERLVQENNSILRDVRRRYRLATLSRIIRYLLIILALGAVYYFIQPYLSQFTEVIEMYQSGFEGIQN